MTKRVQGLIIYNLLLTLSLNKIYRVVPLCALNRRISSLNIVYKTFYKSHGILHFKCCWFYFECYAGDWFFSNVYLGKNYFLIIILCQVFACNPIFMFRPTDIKWITVVYRSWSIGCSSFCKSLFSSVNKEVDSAQYCRLLNLDLPLLQTLCELSLK